MYSNFFHAVSFRNCQLSWTLFSHENSLLSGLIYRTWVWGLFWFIGFFFLNPLLLFHCCFFSLVVRMLSFHDHFHINCLPQFPVFSQSLGLSQNQIRIKPKITDFHYQPLIFSLLLQHFTRTLELSLKKIK